MHILLIEDDEKLSYSLAFQLQKEGFTVDTCEDGSEAFFYLDSNIHDLILLDRMLPNVDGITLLEKLRKKGNTTPVILLTALGELQDKVKGLDSGADDYLVKPFAFEELMARIRCIKRRPREWSGAESIELGDIHYRPSENVLSANTKNCTLSKKEGALLEFLLQNPAQILPRQTLLDRVWGMDAEVEDGNLDNYIHFLRRRLKSVDSFVAIKTIRGIGYRLEDSHV